MYYLPVVGQVTAHQNFVWAAGSVPVAGEQQGWILTPRWRHLVLLGPDELELPSTAKKTWRQEPTQVI